ncbi:MAG: aminotransferase class V-fold PLP-dependent enzyme, partial [Synechococcaceae cyanobacterium]|nr:aminotransferase class V-fold PLP-dependent enzyme [Synechococcaceae cyanobacterium]
AGSGFHRDARRFEVATSCLPLFAGLGTSLQLLEEEGDVASRCGAIRARSRQLWEGLQSIPGVRTLLSEPPPAGLVSFQLVSTALQGEEGRRDPQSIVAELGEQRIWLRTLADPPCVRACTHLTTTEEEVERLLEALRAIAARP